MHGRAKPQESDQSSRTIAGERLPRPQDGQIVDCCPKRTADGVPYKPYAPQPSDTCYVSYDGSISAVRSDTVLTGQHRSIPCLSGSRESRGPRARACSNALSGQRSRLRDRRALMTLQSRNR